MTIYIEKYDVFDINGPIFDINGPIFDINRPIFDLNQTRNPTWISNRRDDFDGCQQQMWIEKVDSNTI